MNVSLPMSPPSSEESPVDVANFAPLLLHDCPADIGTTALSVYAEDSDSILTSLPFDFVFVVDLIVPEKRKTTKTESSRLVGPFKSALSDILSPVSVEQVERLCRQMAPRKGQEKITVQYKTSLDTPIQGEISGPAWNITLFPIKNVQRQVIAMGGLVLVGEVETQEHQKEESDIKTTQIRNLSPSNDFALDEALRESEERHRTLFENMTQGVVYHGADGKVTDANKAALKILGLTMDQVLGKEPMDPHWRFVRQDGSTMPVEEYPAVIALGGQRVESMTFGVVNSMNDDFHWIKLDAVPRFRPGEDKAYQAYTIFTDLTEERKVETRLFRAKEKAEEADQLKSAFLATMSHEIRTPLNGIMGHIDLILSNALAEENKNENLEGLLVAMESGRLLLSIIQDILDLSKIEAGQLGIESNPFSLRCLVENTMKLANAYAIQRKKVQITLTSSIDDDVADLIVGDEYRVQQVLNNLTSNAIKFTDRGSVSLEVNCRSKDSALQLCVSDTGKGIAEDRLDLIFEPFRQSEFGDTRKYGGTGLGLTICKKLVELMGGEMSVRSCTVAGKSGSSFYVSLPYRRARPAQVPQKRNEQTAPKAQNTIRNMIKSPKQTVLVADDDDISRKIARKMIHLAGCEVLEARNGAEAVSMFEKHRDVIDCIVMDVMMPVVDGFEATKRIRLIEQEIPAPYKSVPILALSAGAMKGDKEKGLKAGMNDYLYKPISLKVMMDKLGKCLNPVRKIA